MISARIVADSVGPAGNRITSFLLKYPRFVHCEFLTHRVLSRNAASSRAIPAGKLLAAVLDEPVWPVYWGKNQSGMQAAGELSGWRLWAAKRLWAASRRTQVWYARALGWLGLHKQITNRLVEPFAHITVLATATEWANFFNLRAHKDAQPEFQELAFRMLAAYRDGRPEPLPAGGWHLPFGGKYAAEGLSESEMLKICTARAARLSYLTFEGDIDHGKDYALHDRLAASGHWSPFEHAAMAMSKSAVKKDRRRGRALQGNFRGYTPYRKFFANENRTDLDAEAILRGRRT